jgi:hypothetical protein
MHQHTFQNLASNDYLIKKLTDTKIDILKWMCFFWVTQMAVYVVMILLLLKK